MAVTDLTFTKVDNEWVSTFTSEGACVVEIERNEQSPVVVLANISGMPPVPVATFSNPYVASVVFSLNIAEGVEITIKSAAEVTNAKKLV